MAATRTYSQNQQKQAEQEKKNTEQTAIAELQAKGGEDWNKYQNSNNEAEKQELLKNNSSSYKQASEKAQDWGMGGDKSRAVNAVAMAVTGALGGQTDLQVAANALAPYAANIIGKELGHGEDKNKAAQLAAHAILGAALAYVNGGNPAAGGSAAVASEAAADYLTNQYKDKKEYQDVNGEFQPNLLPEDVKTQIRDLTAAIGAVVGGTVGDSAFNAQLAGVVGQNAVENNEFSIISQGIEKKLAENKKKDEAQPKFSCPKGQSCIIPIPEKTMGEKAIGIINDLTVRQLAAALGAEYDPLTKEYFSPREIQESKVAMLGLGFSKTLSGPIKVTDDVLVAIEKKYGKEIVNTLVGKLEPNNPNSTSIIRNGERLVIRQVDTLPTCGPTSCAMVLDTLGKKVDVNIIIKQANVSEKGTYLPNLANVLRTNGVDANVKYGVTIEQLAEATSKGKPAIVAMLLDRGGHAVVVDGITTRQGKVVVAIRDPAYGRQYFAPIEEFKQKFSRQAIFTGESK